MPRRRFAKNPVGYVKPPFISFNSHDYEAPVLRNENMIITSIDPGVVNCGIYIVSINTKTKEKKSLYMARLEFNKGSDPYSESIKKFEKLESENSYFSASHYIVIESQMAISYKNTRIGQHLISFFMTFLRNKGNRPLVIEFNSQSKTRLLGCPSGMKKPQYKVWCKDKALEILGDREGTSEKKFITYLENSKKKDDMGDAICQSEAWLMVYNGEAVSIPKPFSRFVIEE
tara:strand:+ start:2733 stop:3422 length:690 start_codon:yes stop_codon:yes gene_type:complete